MQGIKKTHNCYNSAKYYNDCISLNEPIILIFVIDVTFWAWTLTLNVFCCSGAPVDVSQFSSGALETNWR